MMMDNLNEGESSATHSGTSSDGPAAGPHPRSSASATSGPAICHRPQSSATSSPAIRPPDNAKSNGHQFSTVHDEILSSGSMVDSNPFMTPSQISTAGQKSKASKDVCLNFLKINQIRVHTIFEKFEYKTYMVFHLNLQNVIIQYFSVLLSYRFYKICFLFCFVFSNLWFSFTQTQKSESHARIVVLCLKGDVNDTVRERYANSLESGKFKSVVR